MLREAFFPGRADAKAKCGRASRTRAFVPSSPLRCTSSCQALKASLSSVSFATASLCTAPPTSATFTTDGERHRGCRVRGLFADTRRRVGDEDIAWAEHEHNHRPIEHEFAAGIAHRTFDTNGPVMASPLSCSAPGHPAPPCAPPWNPSSLA
jgi:hypothetical protein